MEFLMGGAMLLAAVLCALCYRLGFARGVKAAWPRRRAIVLKTDEDKDEERAYEKSLQEQFQALIDYQPEFTAMRK
jgi:hypothetical protein